VARNATVLAAGWASQSSWRNWSDFDAEENPRSRCGPGARQSFMNLFWIAALAILVLLEKVIPSGGIIARLAGLAFMAGGGWMLIQHA